jgi:hypothetical protein
VLCRLQYKHPSTVSRYVALVAVLTGLYIAYGYVSSVEFRTATRSLDLFFLLPAFFTILVSLTGKKWSATLLAAINGLIFLGTPAPFPLHIAISLVVNGLVFDLYLQRASKSLFDPARKHLVIAGILGNLAMAPIGLLVLQLAGFPSSILVWVLALVGDTIVGGVGAFFGATIVERVRGIQTRRVLEATASMNVRAQAQLDHND